MNIEVCKAMLGEQGVAADTALSGNVALSLVGKRFEDVNREKASMYKLILLDYSMPEMEGPQVAMAIRNLFKTSIVLSEGETPYICCCTAYDDAEFKRKALTAGMDDLLTKPISYDELKKLLTRLQAPSK